MSYGNPATKVHKSPTHPVTSNFAEDLLADGLEEGERGRISKGGLVGCFPNLCGGGVGWGGRYPFFPPRPPLFPGMKDGSPLSGLMGGDPSPLPRPRLTASVQPRDCLPQPPPVRRPSGAAIRRRKIATREAWRASSTRSRDVSLWRVPACRGGGFSCCCGWRHSQR
jgi:hypothetical protein